MAISTDQYEAILARLTKLEHFCNDLAVAIERFVTLNQVQQLSSLLQTQVASLQEDVDALETRVELIENEPDV